MNYEVEASGVSWDASNGRISLPLRSGLYPSQPLLDASVTILNDGVVRLFATESSPKHPRHPVQDVLQADALRPFSGSEVEVDKQAGKLVAKWRSAGKGDSSLPQAGPQAGSQPPSDQTMHVYGLAVNYKPFSIELSVDGVTTMQVNSRNLLHFEQYRDRNPRPAAPQPPQQPAPPAEGQTPEATAQAQQDYELLMQAYQKEVAEYEQQHGSGSAVQTWPYDTDAMWSESHGGHTDTRTKGPAAIGLDVSFVNSQHVYGLPEHATSFALKNTIQPDSNSKSADYPEPFRLYNLDVFEYELNEPMALYGAVPYVVAHTTDGKFMSGALWLNAAETYVDISESGGSGGLFSSATTPVKSVHWMSETGVLDLLLVPGPRPSDAFRQYTSLTGAPFMPPQFSIAYHQCRWNYKSTEDVLAVQDGFDKHDIPFDVIWLDIEHTDAKKYFTWDKSNFKNPKEMQSALSAKGRRMVTIVDPHIKRDQGYFLHQDATSQGMYVKNKNGDDYEGWCWPGSASYLDFFQKKVRDFWGTFFNYDKYEGSTPNLFIWNDMNEPSVFNGPEVTMPKDNLHTLDGVAEQVEHRDVHNQYGMYVHMATNQGLVQRSQGQERPFVLTRSFFAGSQRTAAVWTGDNMAKWGHLQAAQPMLLSLAVAQIPFSGADVGGFFGDPDPQLLTRWYQAGAFHPFFRAHAHIDTKRREPWLFGEPYTSIIRQAIRTRYAYLPYIYTLFHANTVTGMPIMRPLWVEFPTDTQTFGVEDSFLLGGSLLIHPITQADQTTAVVYLPGTAESGEVWYDLHSDEQHQGGSSINVLAPLQHIPVFQRGGSIIAKRERARRSSQLMAHDPYTLVIALKSGSKTAHGQLYLDDTHSFNYQRGEYLLQQFTLGSDGVLVGQSLHTSPYFTDANTIERIVLLGAGNTFTQATLLEGTDAEGSALSNVPLTIQAINTGRHLVIRQPGVRISSNFRIKLQ